MNKMLVVLAFFRTSIPCVKPSGGFLFGNKIILALVGVLAAILPTTAATLDLNGTDRIVTTLAGYEAVVNGGAAATLTVSNEVDETFSGTISGPVKLVKRGFADLKITSANTYTGGTEIYCGRLIAGAPQALGEQEIYIDGDCARAFNNDAKNNNNLSALSLDCTSFSTPVRVSSWSEQTPYYWSTRFANYNLQFVQATAFSSPVTGGSLSINCAQQRVVSAPANATWVKPTLSGNIDLTGTVYICTAQTIKFSSPLFRCALMACTGNFWTHEVNMSATEVHIGRYHVGLDTLSLWGGKNLLRGETVIGGTGNYDLHQNRGNLNMARKDQTIDRFIASDNGFAAMEKKDWPHNVYVNSLDPVTFTMRATGDSVCDWRFDNAITLCWWPTNSAYRMTCTANRDSVNTGSIIVSNGIFEVTGAYTFSNVTALVVADGATFEMNGTAPGAFKSVTRVTVGKNATFKMGLVDAFTPVNMTFDLDEDATVIVPDNAEFDVNAILVSGNGLAIGNYTGADGVADATQISQLSGACKIYAMGAPQGETIDATWNAGAGADTAATTVGNWSTSAVAGQFASGKINATFASAGHEATVSSALAFNSLTFSGANPFDLTVLGDAALVAVGVGGITASAAVVTNTVYAPIRLDGSQSWNVGANHELSITGGLRQTVAKSSLLTTTGSGKLNLFGRGDTGTYAGRVDIKGTMTAYGDDPFGRAVEGVDGTITFYGAQNGVLTLGKADNSRTVITKPFSTVGTFLKEKFQLAANSHGSAPWVYVDFLGPVDFASGSKINYNGWHGNLTFAGGGRFFAELNCFGGAFTITNKPMTLSFANTPATTLTMNFNVASNHVDAITPRNYAQTVNFGADWALYEGNTEILLKYHWGNNQYYGTVLDLKGHPQRIGTLCSTIGTPNLATKTPFEVTPTANSQIKSATPATLYVNQTTNGVTIVPFTGKAQLAKEGPAKLVMSNVVNTASGELAVTGGTLELFDSSWKNVTNITVTASSADSVLKLSTASEAASVAANTYFTAKAYDIALVDGVDGKAKLDLADGVFERTNQLVINGQIRYGTWGSSSSTAEHKDDDHFSGSGILYAGGSATLILLK